MRINNLIARFLADKTTREEWEQLEIWKKDSQENLRELTEMQSIWEDTVDLKEYKSFDADSAWDNLEGVLDDDIPGDRILAEPATKKQPKLLTFRWISGIAAAIAILIFSVITILPEDIEGYSKVMSQNTTENLSLPDGSLVVLNKNTEMNYATNFTDDRSVILEGEAYFNVARDEQKPFTIETDCGKVTVLGTSFNIEEKGDHVNVLVTSGSVRVNSGDQEVVLQKNEMVRCGNNGIERIRIPGGNYLSWKTDRLIFNEAPLHRVIQDLSRHFGKSIAFSPQSKAMNIKIADEFYSQDFESVMESIVLITGIKYIKDGNKYVIQ